MASDATPMAVDAAAPAAAAPAAAAPAVAAAAAPAAATPTISVAGASGSSDWTCEKCTYLNKQKDAKCTVCNEGLRPASAAASPASSASPSASPSPNGGAAAAGASPAAAAGDQSKAPEDDAAAVAGLNAASAGKKSSYYYFSSTPKDQAAQYAPKLIDAAAAAAVAPKVDRVGSAWNAAGTWEDRDVSKLAKERLKALFSAGVAVPAADYPHGALSFVSCSRCDGEASIVMTRGKKRVGFELNVQLTFKGTYKGAEVDGTVDIPELDDTSAADGSYAIAVTCAASDVKAFLRSAKGVAVIRKAIDTFVEDMKAQ